MYISITTSFFIKHFLKFSRYLVRIGDICNSGCFDDWLIDALNQNPVTSWNPVHFNLVPGKVKS